MADLIKALGDAIERARADRAKPQTTTVIDWSTTPTTDRVVELPPREGRHSQHRSECLLFINPSLHCTCDDDSPDWTI